MPVLNCQSTSIEGLEESSLRLLHTWGYKVNTRETSWWEKIQDEHTQNTGRWKLSEVQRFCDGVKRYADNIRKVWQLLDDCKTFREVLDFYHRVYPHAQRGGVQRLLELYRRAERAMKGTISLIWCAGDAGELSYFTCEYNCDCDHDCDCNCYCCYDSCYNDDCDHDYNCDYDYDYDRYCFYDWFHNED